MKTIYITSPDGQRRGFSQDDLRAYVEPLMSEFAEANIEDLVRSEEAEPLGSNQQGESATR